jgi:hypothetical protein
VLAYLVLDLNLYLGIGMYVPVLCIAARLAFKDSEFYVLNA